MALDPIPPHLTSRLRRYPPRVLSLPLPASSTQLPVSARNSSTASMALSRHNFHITGALGCLHPLSFATRSTTS